MNQHSDIFLFSLHFHYTKSPLQHMPLTLKVSHCRRGTSVLNRRKSAWQIRPGGISSHWLPWRYGDLIQEVCDFFVSSPQLSTTIECLSKCTVQLIVSLWKKGRQMPTVREHRGKTTLCQEADSFFFFSKKNIRMQILQFFLCLPTSQNCITPSN